jgi:hypothetical protein
MSDTPSHETAPAAIVSQDADGDVLVTFTCIHEGCGALDNRRRPSRGPVPAVCDDCLERSKKLRCSPQRLWPTTCLECNRRRAPRRGSSDTSSKEDNPDARYHAAFSEPIANGLSDGTYRLGQRIQQNRAPTLPPESPSVVPAPRISNLPHGVTKEESALLRRLRHPSRNTEEVDE